MSTTAPDANTKGPQTVLAIWNFTLEPVVLVVEGLQRHFPSGLQVVAHHVGQAACCPVPMDGAWGWCADAAEEEGEVGARHLVGVQQSCRHQAAVYVGPVGPLVGVEAEVL